MYAPLLKWILRRCTISFIIASSHSFTQNNCEFQTEWNCRHFVQCAQCERMESPFSKLLFIDFRMCEPFDCVVPFNFTRMLWSRTSYEMTICVPWWQVWVTKWLLWIGDAAELFDKFPPYSTRTWWSPTSIHAMQPIIYEYQIFMECFQPCYGWLWRIRFHHRNFNAETTNFNLTT